MRSFHVTLAIMVVASFEALDVRATSGQVSTKYITNVQNKFERMVQYNLPTSGVSILELTVAHREFVDWPSEYLEKFRAAKPENSVLVDFVLFPMDQFETIIGHDSKMFHKAYIRRMEEQYTRFRPAYFGELVGTHYSNSPKVDALIGSLRGSPNSKQPITSKMYNDALNEITAYLRKIRQIAEHEDIYSVLDEYMNLLNSINREPVLTMRKVLFPFVKPNLNEAEMALLKQRLVQGLKEKNYDVQGYFMNI